MPGYFGTDVQAALQRRTDDHAEWLFSTPGFCHPGRFFATDALELVDWDMIFEILDRDGVFGFRLLPVAHEAEVVRRLGERSCRIDFWEILVATAADAQAAAGRIVADGLPDGLHYAALPEDAEAGGVAAVQAFLAENGIVPFSGSMLIGEFRPAVTLAVADDRNRIVAVAHAYRPHNDHGGFGGWAWGGLVAVAPDHRGGGLGRFVNARMIEVGIDRLDASHVYEQVAATNVPSRRMVEASGLRLDPRWRSGIAVRDGGRFTA